MNRTTAGNYIPKSRIKSITTKLGKTIGGDKLLDGNGVSDTKIKGKNISSKNDDYLAKSEIRSLKTKDGRVIKNEYLKDGNYLKKTSSKFPKVSRTQFEEEEYSYADGGSVDAETKAKIKNLEEFINNPSNQEKDPAMVEKFRGILEKIKSKMMVSEPKSEPKEEKTEPKTEPKTETRKAGRPKMTAKPVEKPKTETRKAGRPKMTAKPVENEPKTDTKPQKGLKITGSSTVSLDGKDLEMNSKEFCDYLLTKFKERREKSKNAPKKKTQSVMSKITSNIEKSVVQAIKSSVESNKKSIEKNPDFFVKKVEKLETSTKSFLQSMKEVLGSDYEQKEISSTLKNIEELTESLIAKYKKK